MRQPGDRRHLLLASLGGALSLAGWPSVAAEPASAVYLGFAGRRQIAAIPETLQAIRGRYQPELPLELKPLPGNSAARAMEAVHNGPADGSSVLLSPSGVLTLLPHLRTLSTLDPVKDFVPVTPLGEFAHSFVVGPAVPAEVTTLAGYLDWVRADPAQAVYGLAAMGTPPHFAGIAMARNTDIGFKPVGYQGPLPVIKDLLAGSLPAAFMVIAGGRDAGGDPRIRQLALVSDKRWADLPGLPTLRELGIADVSTVESWGFYLPARTPKSKVQELNAAVQQAMRSDPSVVDTLKRAMLRNTPMDADQFAAALARERDDWQTIVRRERFTLQG